MRRLTDRAAALTQASRLVLRGPVLAGGLAGVCSASHLLQRLSDQLPRLFAHHGRLEDGLRLDEHLKDIQNNP